MAWRIPGSQCRTVMKEKEAIARRLIAQGLSNTQISAQLRCSTRFVRDVRSRSIPVYGQFCSFEQ
jgi:DNA-binding NarL/FixJ family response regulator